MQFSIRMCGTIVCVLLLRVSGAGADSVLVVDEREAVKQPTKYRLEVMDDGFANLHLKSSKPAVTARGVNLSLSKFKADGQPTAIVGFGGGTEGTGSLPRSLQNVKISAEGKDLRLAGSALAPDVEYLGQLTASFEKRQTLIWDITLVRPSALAPFECPTGVQSVNPDGSTAIDFGGAAPPNAKAIGLRLSSFISKDQERGQVGFFTDASKGEMQSELLSYSFQGPHFMPPIRAAGLTEGAVYTGRIAFMVDTRDVMECPLELLMPKLPNGELAIDTQSLVRTVTLPWLGFGGDHDVSLGVRLFDKTRAHRIDGIAVALDGVAESPEGAFNLNGYISFWLNGTEVRNFTQLQLPFTEENLRIARTIKPGEQLDVEMRLHDLKAGKYAFALRFLGLNASGSGPKLDVTINVRHHWAWAVLMVVVALLLSFFISMGIVNWREHIRVRERVQQMRAEPYDEQGDPQHADLPSVVFLRAVLDQTEKLTTRHKWILPPQRSIYDYLARAERVVTILRRYTSLQDALDRAQCADSVKYHYRQAIAEQMGRIGPRPLDQKTADAVVEELGAIATRLADPDTWYWSTLKTKAKFLAQQGRAVQDTLGEAEVVGVLLNELETPPTNPDPTVERDFDRKYWMVQLLYSHREFPEETKALIEAYRSGKKRQEVFEDGDRLAWSRLGAPGSVTIEPTSNFAGLQMLRPSTFWLKFSDPLLAESYFVQNVLEYEWSFELDPLPGRFQPAKRRSWSRNVRGPRVTQFAPLQGKLTVGVNIRWSFSNGAKIETVEVPVAPIAFEVGKNAELQVIRNLDGSEFLLMGIVVAATLVTSLPALYFAKATFGSFSDYMAILAWAVGIDQGKNLSQLLKAYTADGAAAPSVPP